MLLKLMVLKDLQQLFTISSSTILGAADGCRCGVDGEMADFERVLLVLRKTFFQLILLQEKMELDDVADALSPMVRLFLTIGK